MFSDVVRPVLIFLRPFFDLGLPFYDSFLFSGLVWCFPISPDPFSNLFSDSVRTRFKLFMAYG